MSLTAPPNQHQPLPPPWPAPPLTLKARLKDEYRHWDEMPVLRLCLLLLPTILLLATSPLLPLVACTLWLWASRSWDWRDRWTSIWTWAKQGGVVVALVLVFAVLSSAQVGIFPRLSAALQTFWHAHIGGNLSLSPTDLDGLVARTLLLLPLAPALALLYERIDPRTHVQPQRILTPADLVEPATTISPPGTSEATPPPSPKTRAQTSPTTSKAVPPQRKRQRKREPSQQQTTIDSFLTHEPTQAEPGSSSRQTTPAPSSEAPPPRAPQPINWDDVTN